jgi:hypothetical protein
VHECQFCGSACDCDGEDTWLDTPDDCICECLSDEDDEDADDQYQDFLEARDG